MEFETTESPSTATPRAHPGRLLLAAPVMFSVLVLLMGCNHGTSTSSGGNPPAVTEDDDPNEGRSPSSAAKPGPIESNSKAIPARDGVRPSAHERACTFDDDCRHVEYDRPVASQSDCYCPICPGDFGRLEPINAVQFEARRQQWQQHCEAWAEGQCEPFPCPVPRPAICGKSGLCQLPALEADIGRVPTPAR
jgi:hypothetical protein